MNVDKLLINQSYEGIESPKKTSDCFAINYDLKTVI